MLTICICGGGSLGHVIAGWLSARNHAKVNILTNRPEKWNYEIEVDTPEGSILKGKISMISKYPEKVVPMADVVLLCLPGFLIKEELEKLKHVLPPKAFVGSVFSSTGFFFEAQKILSDNQPLWGFQRVPFISRVEKYGKSLKYQYSTVSYWLMLLVIVLQIVYIIVFLNDMKINYLEFPVLIINLVITLILFLSAMKVKVHNKKWTYVNFGFSGYLIVRIFAIIPLIAHDYDEVLDEAGEVITQAISYSSLRTVLIVISAIMLGLILISSIISIKRISLREKFMS